MIRRRLKDIASIMVSNVDKKSAAGDLPVHLCNYVDVYNNERITSDLPFMEATATPEQVRQFHLRSGDVVVTKDSETPDDIAVPAYVAQGMPQVICGYHLAIVRPRSGMHGRYLFWALSSTRARQQFSAMANGITRFGLRREALADARVPLPELPVQRAIADYLDAETARIDVLIEKKRRMVELLQEHRTAVVEQAIRKLDSVYGSRPLKHVVPRIEVGIVVTPAAWYSADGVLALRGLNVKPGEIILEEMISISAEGHRLHRKSELHAGDVVVVRTGQTGAAAVVPKSLEGCNCIDVVIVRSSSIALPRYLEFVLNSDWTQKHITEYSVGTIQSHFNVGAMKEVPIPVPPTEEQQLVIEDLEAKTESLRRLHDGLTAQIGALCERRQALITAAVTGELPIPRVAA